jgi:hypothetical protein
MKSLRTFFIYIIAGMLFPVIASAQEWSQPISISSLNDHSYEPKLVFSGNFVDVVFSHRNVADSIIYIRSTDYGQTWSEHFIIAQGGGWLRNAELLRYGSTVICFWARQTRGIYTENIIYRISTDNGNNWSAEHRVFTHDLDNPTILFRVTHSGRVSI